MNLTGRPFSIAYAVLLAGCACRAVYQMFGMMFAIGESGGDAGPLAAAFLIVTALGIAGLAVAALGSWTRYPFFSLVAIAGSVGILPMASIYFRQSMSATIWQFNCPWVPVADILSLILDIAVLWLSWLRFRQLVHKTSPPTLSPQD